MPPVPLGKDERQRRSRRGRRGEGSQRQLHERRHADRLDEYLHCGFGGSNAGYLGWSQMGECDNKLYLVWAQIHERANRFPWRDAATQPAPGVLDDCSYTGARLAMANWELMMSVAQLGTSTLWDAPRNISNTYTPNCGLPGDPEAEQLCGSEWKPSLERQALDETGLNLIWPAAAEVDLSPDNLHRQLVSEHGVHGRPVPGSGLLERSYQSSGNRKLREVDSSGLRRADRSFADRRDSGIDRMAGVGAARHEPPTIRSRLSTTVTSFSTSARSATTPRG